MNLSSSKPVLALILLLSSLSFGGCSALVSPYSSTFQCPNTDKGKCVSVTTAYDESVKDTPLESNSVENNPLVKEQAVPCSDCNKDKQAKKQKAPEGRVKNNSLEYKYQDSLYKKLASLITQPETPIVEPPEVLRVLILSYTGSDNELFSYRYVYFFVTKPRWIISTTNEEK